MLENEELHIVYSGYVFIFRAAHIVEQLKEVTNKYKVDDNSTFLNQARAWFLKIDPVRIVGMRVHVCACVCVSTPEAIIN